MLSAPFFGRFSTPKTISLDVHKIIARCPWIVVVLLARRRFCRRYRWAYCIHIRMCTQRIMHSTLHAPNTQSCTYACRFGACVWVQLREALNEEEKSVYFVRPELFSLLLVWYWKYFISEGEKQCTNWRRTRSKEKCNVRAKPNYVQCALIHTTARALPLLLGACLYLAIAVRLHRGCIQKRQLMR